MSANATRRDFLRALGLSAGSVPFILNLPSLAFANQARRKQRMVVMFSPNGVDPAAILARRRRGEIHAEGMRSSRSRRFKKQIACSCTACATRCAATATDHMRGIGCLLTGIELFPGNIQGGSDTPAGWASGISIDQEIKNKLQKDDATRTRFGSLEFGVMVPDRADTWTRMAYAGPNKPITPIDDPYQMFGKLYGKVKDRELLASVLDDVQDDLKKVSGAVSSRGSPSARRTCHVRPRDGAATPRRRRGQGGPSGAGNRSGRATRQRPHAASQQDANRPDGEQLRQRFCPRRHAAIHQLGRPGEDALARHRRRPSRAFARARLERKGRQTKLIKINHWFCEQLAYLAKRLSETPEPGGQGSLLDNTLIVWTNELGKGNSHTLDNIPFVLVGGGLDFKMGRSMKFPNVPHNRLLLSLAHGFGHRITKFGDPEFLRRRAA